MKRFSAQRQAVYEAVCAVKSHPTAEWVFETVRTRMPHISLGTVYRNLSDLKKEGLLCGFTDAAGVEHFDATVTDHPHFICECCGSVIDLPEERGMAPIAELPEGAALSRRVLLYYGTCARCKNKNQ